MSPLDSSFPRRREFNYVNATRIGRDIVGFVPRTMLKKQSTALDNLKPIQIPLRFALPPFSKWVVVPHFEKGGLGGIYDVVSYCYGGLFAMLGRLNYSFTIVHQGKCFAAIAAEVLE